ncbi:JNK-interacting protein 3 isoform X4 [Ischnura elegans]|uniref:JNK-interacting protein 3 isoform X4 n=1 Tax=Ischnura elegans TaxID=197161 RepID=UPI001ED8B588|nr:JNK-interacting protein 3 isoform X4 [Ischnura elegans]
MMELEQETVYGTHEDSHIVMSENVQSLAGSIYQEFEKMISKYDEDVVKELMPLVVNVLECLDLSYTENQEHEVELELLREDNEQLVTQYEREKQLRKASEQKLLEIEDVAEDDRKNLHSKIESLESIVRMLELKGKNSSDHVSRLEERESEMKKEYGKLHDRYTELFKTHMDYMERTKIMMGPERVDSLVGTARPRIPGMSLSQLNRSSGPVSFGFGSLEPPVMKGGGIGSPLDFVGTSPPESNHSNTSLRNELQNDTKATESPLDAGAGNQTPGTQPSNMETSGGAVHATDETSMEIWSEETSPMGEIPDSQRSVSVEGVTPTDPQDEIRQHQIGGRSHTKKEQRIGNTLYQELSFQDADALGEMDEGADITGSWVHPGEYASSDSEEESHLSTNKVNDNFFGMGKEVENLIMENNELLATKNALNIVKDDLIVKVDELTSEQDMLREEIRSLQTVKERLKQRVGELEEELKRVREEAERAAKVSKSDDEEDVPMAQRKRFTRMEMARVLMERNQYKEKFMDLQEAVRVAASFKARKDELPPINRKKKSPAIFNFFSSLFRGPVDEQSIQPKANMNVTYSPQGHHSSPAMDTMRKRSLGKHYSSHFGRTPPLEYLDVADTSSGKLQQKRATERSEQYRQVQAHVRKDEGRIQAYGWSLPVRGGGGGSAGGGSGGRGGAGGGVGSLSNPAISSLAAASASSPSAASSTSHHHIPVPVPVFCQPLTEDEPGMKVHQVWCAAGVDLTGGRTSDGGSIVGASVFYLKSPTEGSAIKAGDATEEVIPDSGEGEVPEEARTNADGAESTPASEEQKLSEGRKDIEGPSQLEKLDRELREGERLRREGEELERQLSSLVWICTSTLKASKVTVVDANNPAVVLASFEVCSSHLLCIASVPGAKEDDYLPNEEEDKLLKKSLEKNSEPPPEDASKREEGVGASSTGEEKSKIGSIEFVSCATGCEAPAKPPSKEAETSVEEEPKNSSEPSVRIVGCGPKLAEEEINNILKEASVPGDGSLSPNQNIPQDLSGLIKDGLSEVSRGNELAYAEVEKMSSVLPTMWLGSKTGAIYVHSSVAHWRRCIHSIKLKDSVLSIVHIRGRVLAALANGTVAVFRRHSFEKEGSGGDGSEKQHLAGQWDLGSYFLVDLGEPHKSIRCMSVVHSKVWCGYGNHIHVLDPRTLEIEASFNVHPRKDSQVRQMAWLGDGVWVSIRMDSTLRLYHAHTYEHLQDVDIEPYVSKMLGTGKVGFSFARITALLISSCRLWIGTGNGVIISVPLLENAGGRAVASHAGKVPGSVVRVYTDSRGTRLTPGSFIPYCSIAHVQISFHGHHDAVKFFVAVPGSSGQSSSTTPAQSPMIEGYHSEPATPMSPPVPVTRSMRVMSGGEGYIDFRNGDGDEMDGMDRSSSHAGHHHKVLGGDGEAGRGEEGAEGVDKEGEMVGDDLDDPMEVRPSSLMDKGGSSQGRGDTSYLIVWQVDLPAE